MLSAEWNGCGFSNIVDCSHGITNAMPHWPGDPLTQFTPCATMEKEGYRLRAVTVCEHAGTHCNAPNTFFADGKDIATLLSPPPVLPVAVADFSAQAAADAGACFTPEDLLAWEARNGMVAAGSLFCLHTGWSAFWDTPWRFFGWSGPVQQADILAGNVPPMRFPAFAPETAQLLTEKRKVRGLGIDTHGVDSPADAAFSVNRTVLAMDGLVLECLANLHLLPPVGSVAIIGGMRLMGGTGTPVSVTVLTP